MVNLITLTAPRSAAAEAIRTLRTNLMFSDSQRPLHTLMVTSAANPEDKSHTLANLAVAFAQSGHSTILVDADLRRPAQHDIWGLKNDAGLTTMLQDDASLATPPLQETSVDKLSVLCAGPLPDVPADLLSSPRMAEIISLLKARADYVLFDAPPVLAATDAALIGRKMDAALLTIRANTSRRDHAAQARQALEQVGVHLLGAVLTNAPRERSRAY